MGFITFLLWYSKPKSASERMIQMEQQWRQHKMFSHIRTFRCAHPKTQSYLVALACVLLLGIVSCGQRAPRANLPAASPFVNQTAPRNHVPPNGYWRLVHVTFKTEITYTQAQMTLNSAGVSAYPMINPPCGDLREMGAPIPVSTGAPDPEPTPMSPEALRADFQQSHRLLVQTDSWEKLNRIAVSPDVVSVDLFPLPNSCPAQAPI